MSEDGGAYMCTVEWPLGMLEGLFPCCLHPLLQAQEKDRAVASSVVPAVAGIHSAVLDTCVSYFSSVRRRVCFTPRSYLTFINYFNKLYRKKMDAMKVCSLGSALPLSPRMCRAANSSV